MTAAIGGVLAAIATPFDRATGAVAEDALRTNVAALLADGLAGVVVAGSTGEAPLLDPEEVRRLVAVARDAVPRGRWLLAGTGAEATRQAVALSRRVLPRRGGRQPRPRAGLQHPQVHPGRHPAGGAHRAGGASQHRGRQGLLRRHRQLRRLSGRGARLAAGETHPAGHNHTSPP
jgi:hypothetical protein